MKTPASYLRILGFLLLAFILIEITVETEAQFVVQEYPLAWVILGVVLLIAVAIEVSVLALHNILLGSLKEEAREKYLETQKLKKENQFSWFKRTYEKLLDKKPIEEEKEIVLDHNYDGIQELDNNLPPWWLYGFYASIVFAAGYMAYYHIFDGIDQDQEYQIELAEAKAAIEEYKKNATDLVDASTVQLLTDPSDLDEGEAIYIQKCAACHKPDGGGSIGPNLTDDHWILGGGIKNVFTTVSEGGRDGKGMVAWKSDLSPAEIAQVSSYVLSLHGTNPADAKGPEGEVWEE